MKPFYFAPPIFLSCSLYPTRTEGSFYLCQCCWTSSFAGWQPYPSLEDLVCRNWKNMTVHTVNHACLANSTGVKTRLTLAN